MNSLEIHEKIEQGYNRIYKGFAKTAKNYERKKDYKHAELFRDISERFRLVHEKAVENVKMLREKEK